MSASSDDNSMDAETEIRKGDLRKILEEEERQKKMARSAMIQQINNEKQLSKANGGLDCNPQAKEIMRPPSVVEVSHRESFIHGADLLEVDQLCNFRPLRLRSSVSCTSGNSTQKGIFSPGMTEATMLKQEDEEKQLLRRRKVTLTDEDLQKIPRMVHRNMPFHQSRNDIAVFKENSSISNELNNLLSHDWYHIVLRWPTALSLLSLLFIWTLVILIFAFVYKWLDSPESDCGLGAVNSTIGFSTAFAFSLETCTTVGYGLPNSKNSFFEPECGELIFFIYLQMVFSMMFNGFLFAFMFARLARCESRAVQVLFSNKAIIEIQDGKWYMHVRVYDMDSAQPVIEAHIRMYCVSWRDYEDQIKAKIQPHLLHHMRILIPNDDLGSMMYTSVPGNVTHHIDAYSPLTPPDHRKKVNTTYKNKNIAYLNDVELREIDDMTGNRSDIPCPVCGEIFGLRDHLDRHIRYMKVCEDADENLPIAGTHRDLNIIKPNNKPPVLLTETDLKEHLVDKEIMCVVEAIEPMVSGTFQALQSYKLEDMVFGGSFAPCMSQKDGKIFVDVNKFHTVRAPSDSSIHYYNSRGHD